MTEHKQTCSSFGNKIIKHMLQDCKDPSGPSHANFIKQFPKDSMLSF